MDNNTAILSLSYRLSVEEYINFNMTTAKKDFGKKKMKTTIMGAIYLVVALILVIVANGNNSVLRDAMVLMSVFLFCFGLYSVTFYSILFPKALRSSAVKNFAKSNYLQNIIRLDFYPDRLVETSEETENSFNWTEITALKETSMLYIIELNNRRCILASKSAINDQIYELTEFIKLIGDKYSIPFITMEEK